MRASSMPLLPGCTVVAAEPVSLFGEKVLMVASEPGLPARPTFTSRKTPGPPPVVVCAAAAAACRSAAPTIAARTIVLDMTCLSLRSRPSARFRLEDDDHAFFDGDAAGQPRLPEDVGNCNERLELRSGRVAALDRIAQIELELRNRIRPFERD